MVIKELLSDATRSNAPGQNPVGFHVRIKSNDAIAASITRFSNLGGFDLGK